MTKVPLPGSTLELVVLLVASLTLPARTVLLLLKYY